MKKEKKFVDQIKDGNFIVTAEYLPTAETEGSAVRAAMEFLKEVPSAVNVSDNPFGVVMSSLAASVLLASSGIEPICQFIARDRNRIALQSDLLGAAALGIRNVLCLSGYHQTLTDSAEAANVYDLDSLQLLSMAGTMRKKGELLNGQKISGILPLLTGAVANPYLKPLELNLLRVTQKVEAGADFIQTHAVFDVGAFQQWLEALREEGVTDRTAILAGVFPLESAAEAEFLSQKYTEFRIPDAVIQRLKSAGDAAAQKKEGLALCVETISKIKNMKGLRGIHILSGGKEDDLPEILSASGLSAQD